jgi:hypothetical protein
MSPDGEKSTQEEMPPPPPDEPVESDAVTSDDSILADQPDTTTGKEQLVQNDEGRPGPGV